MKRTALTHAAMNGNTHLVSYFLSLGADPNHTDSSGNSVVHYAAAYGWFFCLKLLVANGGANPNLANDWKVIRILFTTISFIYFFFFNHSCTCICNLVPISLVKVL